MPRATVFGLQLDSDIEFPELTQAAGEGLPATFRLGEPGAQARFQNWVHETAREDGAPWLSVGPAGERRLVRFHGQVDFLLGRGNVDVVALPVPGTALETIRWLFLDHILPRALAASGRPVLHASAVETKQGALVFVGESGSGKSTLAASLCADGARLLSDDGVLIDRLRVIPSYPVHRLWPSGVAFLGKGPAPDSRNKNRVTPAVSWDASPAKLHRIFVLEPHQPGRAWIQRAHGGEGMVALVKQAFRLDPTDRDLASAEFKNLADLTLAVPPLMLAIPRGAENLVEAKTKLSEFS